MILVQEICDGPEFAVGPVRRLQADVRRFNCVDSLSLVEIEVVNVAIAVNNSAF